MVYLNFEDDQNNSKSPVIYCNDVNKLIDQILEVREVDSSNARVKFGIDSGGGYLKFCMSIFQNTSRRMMNERKVIDRGFSDTGVKKIMILALTPNVKETYNNVKILFDLLRVHEIHLHVFYSVDLKMANIICGLQSHSSSYPCVWCRCPKDEFRLEKSRSYPIRTVGDIKQNASDFAVSHCKSAKDFESSVHEPLFPAKNTDILCYAERTTAVPVKSFNASNELSRSRRAMIRVHCTDWRWRKMT